MIGEEEDRAIGRLVEDLEKAKAALAEAKVCARDLATALTDCASELSSAADAVEGTGHEDEEELADVRASVDAYFTIAEASIAVWGPAGK